MRKSILVLEENKAIHEMADSALSLRQWGWSVHHERSPDRFFATARKYLSDLILLSNSDQKKNYSLLKSLRKDKKLRDIPIVLLASRQEKLDKRLLSSLKVRAVVRTPFERSTLRETVLKVLRLSPGSEDRISSRSVSEKKCSTVKNHHKPNGSHAVEIDPATIGMVEVRMPGSKVNLIPGKPESPVHRGSGSAKGSPAQKLKNKPEKDHVSQVRQDAGIRNSATDDASKSDKKGPSGVSNGENQRSGRIDMNKRMMVARYTEFRRIILPEGSVMFTSANLGDGSSLIASELAISQAFSPDRKKPILFVDLNSYRSTGSLDLLEKDPEDKLPGIADVLNGNCQLEACIYPTRVPNLFVLPFGNLSPDFDPVSHLAVLKRILREELDDYRPLIDTCNMMAKNRYNFDPVELAHMVDSVVFVVMSGTTTRDEFQQCKIDLESYDVAIKGVILNERENVSFLTDFKAFVRKTRNRVTTFIRDNIRPFFGSKKTGKKR